MSAASQILKNFNLSVDGRGYAGNIDEVQLPTLAVKNEEYRAGGMDAAVELDMGMEKLETTFKLSRFSPDLLALFGLGPQGTVQLTFRGAVESLDGTVEPVNVYMAGTIDAATPDSITPGAKAGWQFKMSVRAYRYEQNGVTIHDIDVVNMKRVIGGVDRLSKIRASIGL